MSNISRPGSGILLTQRTNEKGSSPLRDRLEEALVTVAAPLLRVDGGAVRLVDATSSEVVLEVSGACVGCPGLPITRKSLLEPLCRNVVGEDVRVEIRQNLDFLGKSRANLNDLKSI